MSMVVVVAQILRALVTGKLTEELSIFRCLTKIHNSNIFLKTEHSMSANQTLLNTGHAIPYTSRKPNRICRTNP
jgi:hypothetical protein